MSYIFTGVEVTNEVTGNANTSRRAIRVATTANITISTALNVGDIIDGVVLADGDRVLVKNQSTGSQNGIYIAGAVPVRSDDYAESSQVGGTFLIVTDGIVNADSLWLCSSNPPNDVVGVNNLTYIQMGGANIGYVTGPGSSTVNAIPRFNTSDGNSVANSGILIDGSNNITGIAAITTAGNSTFNSVVISTSNNISGVANISATTGTFSGAVSTGALSVTGNITVTGNVDGVDISQIPINFNNLLTTKGDLMVYNGSNIARLAAGTNNYALTANSTTSTGLEWKLIDGGSGNGLGTISVLQTTANNGVGGGSATANSWNTRILSTFKDSLGGTLTVPSNGGFVIISNTFMIPEGKYLIYITSSVLRVSGARVRLQQLGQVQKTTIGVNAASTLAQTGAGSYFDYNTTTTAYRFWFNISGGNVAPAAGGRTLVSIAITTGNSAIQVAAAIRAVIQPATYAASAENINDTIIIRNTAAGSVTAAAAGTSGFSVSSTAGNATNTTISLGMSNVATNAANTASTTCTLNDYIELTNPIIMNIDQRTGAVGGTASFQLGAPSSSGNTEIYMVGIFSKIVDS